MPPKRSLSDEQIAHVRWLRECDTTRKWSKLDLAVKFGVSVGCIQNVIYYVTAPLIEARKPEETQS